MTTHEDLQIGRSVDARGFDQVAWQRDEEVPQEKDPEWKPERGMGEPDAAEAVCDSEIPEEPEGGTRAIWIGTIISATKTRKSVSRNGKLIHENA